VGWLRGERDHCKTAAIPSLREEDAIEGGAVAHGHPIGATGAVLTTKLIHSMRRDGLTRGLVTLCIGGGQGIALSIEALH
jgi:acetyl-CoA acetyltransferase